MNETDEYPLQSEQAIDHIRSLIATEEYQTAMQMLRMIRTLHGDHPVFTELTERCRELQARSDRLQSLRQQANQLMATEQFRSAEDAWKEVLAIAPGDTEAINAIQELRQVMASAAETVEIMSEIRRAYLKSDYEHALRLLKDLPDEQSHATDIQQMYADLLTRRSHREMAERLQLQAEAAYAKGDIADALDLWGRALELDPRLTRARRGRDDARKDLARKEVAKTRKILLDSARRWLQCDDLSKARGICEQFLEQWPEDVEARNLCKEVEQCIERKGEAKRQATRGDAAFDDERFEEAITRWEMTRQLNPAYPGLDLKIKQARALRSRRESLLKLGEPGGSTETKEIEE